MQEYYNRRAEVYEQIYARDDLARRAELKALLDSMCNSLAGQDVLEVACGTGYWTERLANHASKVVATDASTEMLSIASHKMLPATVQFSRADAFDLGIVAGEFNGGLANFWLSHVPRERLLDFLNGFHRKLSAGAHVFIADNCYVPGVGGELVVIEGSPDTYKRRRLDDGTEHIILKNYHSPEELRALFEPLSIQLSVHIGDCYWWVSYVLP